MKKVIVVIGVGGIGQAIARRQGAGKAVLLADVDEGALSAAATAFEGTGYSVTTQRVDVSSRASVRELANAASSLGEVTEVVHAAGLSPNMAAPDKILAVDLLGTALVVEEFGSIIVHGGAGIVISSMAGHMIPALPAELDQALAKTPADELLKMPDLQPPPSRAPARPTRSRRPRPSAWVPPTRSHRPLRTCSAPMPRSLRGSISSSMAASSQPSGLGASNLKIG